jgi:hypothetical protein
MDDHAGCNPSKVVIDGEWQYNAATRQSAGRRAAANFPCQTV